MIRRLWRQWSVQLFGVVAAFVALLLLWVLYSQAESGVEIVRGSSSSSGGGGASSPVLGLSQEAASGGLSTAEESDERETVGCSIGFINPSGGPIPGCEALVWSDGDPAILRRISDRHGDVQLPARDGQGGVLARAPDGSIGVLYPIHLVGRHSLTLGGPAEVSGRVFVDGDLAPAGMLLHLRTSLSPLPAGAPDSLRVRPFGSSNLRQARTGHDGSFTFHGLAMDWRGSIVLPATHWMQEGDVSEPFPEVHPLSAPATGIELRTTALPLVAGRVLWADDRGPISAANVVVLAAMRDGSECSGNAITSADGSFAVGITPKSVDQRSGWMNPIHRPALNRLEVHCWNIPGSAGTVVQKFDAFGLDPRSVEILIPRGQLTWFSVVDPAGLPIVGARVDVPGSTASDESGRGYYTGAVARRVGAPGYGVVNAHALDGDGTRERPFRFMLQPLNSIRLLLEAKHLAVASDVQWTLESAMPVLATGQDWSDFHAEFGGSRCVSGSRTLARRGGIEEQVQMLFLTPDLDGTATVHSLSPGVACKFLLQDRLGELLASVDLVTPPIGRSIDVKAVITARPRILRGMVRQIGGQLCASAEVQLRKGAARITVQVAADGSYQLPAFWGDEAVDLWVWAPGFVGQLRERISAEESAVPQEFQLVAGRTVVVKVVCAGGRPVDLPAQPLGFESLQAQRLGEGVWQWRDMPDSVEFYVEIQDVRYSVRCDQQLAEVVLQVPVVSRVVLAQAAIPEDLVVWGRDCMAEMRPLSNMTVVAARVGIYREGEAGNYVFPGRYVISLVGRRLTAGGTLEYVPLGPQTTVDVLPGHEVRVGFR